MDAIHAEFLISNTDINHCPEPSKPEFAFIGRSNVGKSSLINMITNNKTLAKTSSKPGKTQTINHFIVNESWYLVDLPGYGYASVSKSLKKNWGKMIESYILKRPNLDLLFILIDARHDPQPIDLRFIEWAGAAGVPIALILTKTDKINKNTLQQNKFRLEKALLESWEELPPMFITSATEKTGRKEILRFITNTIQSIKN